jgi:hypothetical protein
MDELVLNEIEQIRRQGKGVLYPESVVMFAENEKTALHTHFEWDDSAAGHQWRLQQSRQLITYYFQETPGTNFETQVYVSLTSDRYAEKNRGGYRALVDVMSDKEMREQLLLDSLNDFQVFKRKYFKLKELASVFDEIDKVERKVKKKK